MLPENGCGHVNSCVATGLEHSASPRSILHSILAEKLALPVNPVSAYFYSTTKRNPSNVCVCCKYVTSIGWDLAAGHSIDCACTAMHWKEGQQVGEHRLFGHVHHCQWELVLGNGMHALRWCSAEVLL